MCMSDPIQELGVDIDRRFVVFTIQIALVLEKVYKCWFLPMEGRNIFLSHSSGPPVTTAAASVEGKTTEMKIMYI